MVLNLIHTYFEKKPILGSAVHAQALDGLGWSRLAKQKKNPVSSALNSYQIGCNQVNFDREPVPQSWVIRYSGIEKDASTCLCGHNMHAISKFFTSIDTK